MSIKQKKHNQTAYEQEIADRNTQLSKRKKISLDKKIEIFSRFAETGEELTGQTIFEGYPIGIWGYNLETR